MHDGLWIAAEWVLSQRDFSMAEKCGYLERLGEVYAAFAPLEPQD